MNYKLIILLSIIILSTIDFTQADTLYLSLDDALNLAQKQSSTAQEVLIDKRSGALSLASSIAALLPTPTAQASYGKTTISNSSLPTDYNYSATVGLNQVVLAPDAFGNVVKGKLYNDYYRLQAKDKSANLIYAVKTSYFNLAKTYHFFQITLTTLERAEKNYNLAKEKNRLKQITDFELLRAETYLTQAQIDLLTAEKNLRVSTEDLKGQIGLQDNLIIKPTFRPSLPSVEIDFNSLLTMINNNNPSLQSSQKYKSIAKTSHIQSIANVLPSASLYWTSTFTDTITPKSKSHWQNKDVISYGLRLNFPVLEIKSYLLNIGNTRNEFRRADLQLKKAETLLQKSALNAIFSYQEAKERYHYAEKNLQLNQTLLKLAQEQYRLGGLSQLDLLNTEIAYTTAQNTYYASLYDAYISYAQIEYLLGISDLNEK